MGNATNSSYPAMHCCVYLGVTCMGMYTVYMYANGLILADWEIKLLQNSTDIIYRNACHYNVSIFEVKLMCLPIKPTETGMCFSYVYN